MPPEIKRILYATDLSPNATYAMRYANMIARQNDAHVVILHVIEKMSATVQALLSSYLDKDQLEARSQAAVDYQTPRPVV